MEHDLRDGKKGQTHKLDLSIVDQNQINTKLGERYVSTNAHGVEAAGVVIKTKAGTATSERLYHQPAQESQLIISKQVSKSSQVWDCGSALYDSFELNSFNRQLDSAIKASIRANSMPHLPYRRSPSPIPNTEPVTTTLTKHQTLPMRASKLSKSLKKIMKSVFKSSSTSFSNNAKSQLNKPTSSEKQRDGNFYVYDGSKSVRILSTIPEMQECDEPAKLPLETTPVVRRAASERFTATLVSVSCKSRYY